MYCTYSSPSFRIRKDCKLRFLVRKRNYGTKEFLIEWIFYRLIYIFVPLLSNQERFLERKNYETEGIFSKVDLLQIDVHIRPPPFELEKIVNSDFWRGRGTMERKEFLVKQIFYRLMSSPSFRIRIRLGKIVNFDFWRGRRTLERKEFLIFHNTYEYPDYYTYNVYIFQHI